MGMRACGKDEVQTCARDDSSQSDRSHEIPNRNSSLSLPGSTIVAREREKITRASSYAFEIWCTSYELDELWSVEYGLMDECYIQSFE
jgi:hypothetical protein